MRALVTGGTGFLGQKLARRLRDGGCEVTALGRNEAIGRELSAQGITFVRADLADAPAVAAACDSQDVVFHSGALSSPWGAYEAFYAANVVGTANVVAGCRSAGVRRLIHVSTPSLYFDFRDRLAIREDEPLPRKGVNAYAETKRQAEGIIDRAFAEGLPVITIRPRGLFGPGDTAILPRLIRANERGAIPLFGGDPLIDLTYVENVVDALLCCQEAPESALGRKYNISNGTPVRLAPLLERLFSALDRPFNARRIPYPLAMGLAGAMELAASWPGAQEPLLTRYTVGVLAFSQTLDITAARTELGYVPRVSIDEGLERFVAWWREQPRG